MSLVVDLTNFSIGHGFGINTNILETNVINLAVVVGVVVTFVGDALKSLLENRRQAILNNLKEADQKAFEAQERLNQAKAALNEAVKKADMIKQQSVLTAEQESQQVVRQTQEELARLEQSKQDTIQLQRQRAIQQLSQQVITLALSQVKNKLAASRKDAAFHNSVNQFHIVLLTNYKA
jgi:F-type H+-transporting ATPase subunit b